MTKQKTPESRPYRIILHNTDATKKNVSNTLESELGKVELLNFKIEQVINYEALAPGSSCPLPQREIIIKLNYNPIKSL